MHDQVIIASVDCTGHGVSGAFMSITGYHLLNKAVQAARTLTASEILDNLNEEIKLELHGKGSNEDVQDGMDIALCIVDIKNKSLQYAGANNPLYILRNREIIQVKANKFSIGLTIGLSNQKFANHKVQLEEKDELFLFSDGYADQLGGETGFEKFMYQRFRELLISIAGEPMEVQKRRLEENFQKWKGNVDQLDDVLVIGFQL